MEQFELTEVFVEDLKNWIGDKLYANVISSLERLYPADIAEVFYKGFAATRRSLRKMHAVHKRF